MYLRTKMWVVKECRFSTFIAKSKRILHLINIKYAAAIEWRYSELDCNSLLVIRLAIIDYDVSNCLIGYPVHLCNSYRHSLLSVFFPSGCTIGSLRLSSSEPGLVDSRNNKKKSNPNWATSWLKIIPVNGAVNQTFLISFLCPGFKSTIIFNSIVIFQVYSYFVVLKLMPKL